MGSAKILNINNLLRLGLVALVVSPFFASSAASAATASTTISSVVSPVISTFTTSGTVNVNVAPVSGTVQSIDKDTITVSTNDTAGYTLTFKDANTSNDLCITPGGSCTGIAATSGTSTTPALMSSANIWGYHIDDGTTKWCSTASNCGAALSLPVSNASTSTTLKFALVPLSSGTADTLKTTSSTATNDTMSVYYAVNADTALATGTYTDVVTYTATAN